MQGITFNAVQRNKGIDTILVEQYENSPILIRVQKQNETLEQAASLLAKAMLTKKSKRSVLIKTSLEEDLFEAATDIEGMEVILPPALQISALIKKS